MKDLSQVAKFLKIVRNYLNIKRFLPLLLIILTGCYTQKKAAKQTDKAFYHYPGMVAGKHVKWFPITQSENIISNIDTLVDIQVMPCDSFVRVVHLRPIQPILLPGG